MFLLWMCFMIGSATAAGSPAVLEKKMGSMTIVTDSLGLRLTHEAPDSISRTLINLIQDVRTTKVTLKVVPRDISMNNTSIHNNIMWKVNMIEHILKEFYSKFVIEEDDPFIKRTKRGWINLGGSILKTVFGTATEDDLKGISNRIDDLESVLGNQNRIFNLEFNKLNEIASHVNTLQNLVTQAGKVISEIAQQASYLQRILEISTHIDNIFLGSTNLEATYIQMKNALIHAEFGQVTMDLVPTSQLYTILKSNIEKFHLSPLLPLDKLEFLYSYLQVHIYNNIYIILIPFASDITFTHYKISPFPIILNNQLVTLDNIQDNLFLSQNLEHHAWLSNEDFTNHCHSPTEILTICPAYSIKIIPSLQDACPLSIVNNQSIIKNCNFKVLPKKPFYHVHNNRSHHLFFPSEVGVGITCFNDIPSTKHMVSGLIIIPDHCKVVTSLVTIYPTKYHYTTMIKQSKIDEMFYSIPNISANVTEFQLNSPHLDTIKLINKSMLAINYVHYYHPQFAIPVFGSPILIIIIVIIIAFVALHRMSRRLSIIENALLNRVPH